MCTFSIILQGNICSITANILLGFENTNSLRVKTFSKVQKIEQKSLVYHIICHIWMVLFPLEWGAVILSAAATAGRYHIIEELAMGLAYLKDWKIQRFIAM